MQPLRFKALAGLSVGALLLVACVITGVTLLAWMRLATMGDLPAKTGQVRIVQMQRVADVKFGVTEAASALRLAMIVNTPEDLQKATASVATMHERVDRIMGAWRLDIITPSGQQRFDQVEQLVAQFWQSVETDVAHIEAGEKEEALASLMMGTTPLLGKLYGALEYEQERQGDLLSASVSSVEEMVWTVRNQMLFWAAGGIAALFGVFWYLVRTLRRRQLSRN